VPAVPETRFPTPAGELPGYLALPVTPGPWPGVTVVHEAFGLNDDIRQSADRLAAAGYVALAPDLYGWGSTPRCLQATFRSLLAGRGRAFDDLDGARLALAGRDDCTGRVGVVGFCMGGGFALLAATRGFDASAPCYGVLPKDLDAALAGACPVVASYGGRDRALRGAAGRLDAALDRQGVPHDVVEYPDAGTRSSTGTTWARSGCWSASRASATTTRPPRTPGGASSRFSTPTCATDRAGPRAHPTELVPWL
jgi:carboxymethylenebutenolidase